MNAHPLFARLLPLTRRRRWERVAFALTVVWCVAAPGSAAVLWAVHWLGIPGLAPASILAGASLLFAAAIAVHVLRQPADLRAAARAVEARHPELNGLVLTAVQQEPDPDSGFSFLQRRLLDEALGHSIRNDWRHATPPGRFLAIQALQVVALALFVSSVLLVPRHRTAHGSRPTLFARFGSGLEITPGDTSLERGSSLVVLARFGGAPPRDAELVLAGTNGTTHRLPLVRNLADPVFGGTVPDVTTNFNYRVEFAGGRSQEFKVSVYEHPRLERSTVDLTFPAYTGRTPSHIEDTRRVTAVEGSRLDLALQFNKPVATAALRPRGTNLPTIPLSVDPARPIATLVGFPLATGATYDLALVDTDGRTNKVGAQFVFEVPPNRVPELRLASPNGDLRPSPLEEITFDGTVWDDFGIPSYGIGFVRVGNETEYVELGRAVAATDKRPFHHLLRLEDLGAKPDQVLGWFVWADDIGPDGQVRRTTGDIFFAEVRPFEEVFREGEGSGGGDGGDAGQAGGGNPTTKLAELQKQILTATWKLQSRQRPAAARPPARSKPNPPPSSAPSKGNPQVRAAGGPDPGWLRPSAQFFAQRAPRKADEPAGSPSSRRAARPSVVPSTGRYEEDLVVIRDAAAQALEQARGQLDEQTDPRQHALWASAVAQMERALEQLEKAGASPASLPTAIEAEQAAYQALLQLQSRETEVTRARKGGQGQSGQGRNQRQLEQLDLTQSENRYETQRQARAPVDEEHREQLQTLNRLQELAHRQQDVNQRLKELQTALQAASDDKKIEELRRQLKRLQEEERQNLADADELLQRMNRPENQSQTADQRKQLEQTRDDMQRAADATGEGKVSQALAAGTRAERQLKDLREEIRKKNANEFNDGVRELRNDARELAREQSDIKRQLDQPADPRRKALGEDATRQRLLDRLTSQEGRLTNLVERATRLSEQAETSEPLLSRQLEDTLRKFSQDDTGNLKQIREELLRQGQLSQGLNRKIQKNLEESGAKSLELTRELLRQEMEGPARKAEQKAREGIDTLRQGVERAAGTVLGDDTEALRLAQQELDDISRQLEKEMEAAVGAEGQKAGRSKERASTNRIAGIKGEATGASPNSAGAEPDEGKPGAPSNQGAPGTTPGQSGPSGGFARQGQPDLQGQPAQPPGEQPGQPGQPGQNAQAGQGGPGGPGGQPGRPGGPSLGRGGPATGPADGGFDLTSILATDPDRRAGNTGTGPITGEDFAGWSDRLRDVEELIEAPDLRNTVANSRDQARRLRMDYRRDRRKPDWAVVRLQVLQPLVEVRDQIREELSRRAAQDPLVPLDRDPVPGRYSDLVRRYYEELGRDK